MNGQGLTEKVKAATTDVQQLVDAAVAQGASARYTDGNHIRISRSDFDCDVILPPRAWGRNVQNARAQLRRKGIVI